MDAKPPQIFDHRTHKFSAGALRVQIFVTQNQSALMLDRALSGDQEGTRMAEMEQSRR
jgi:hypothetical protein